MKGYKMFYELFNQLNENDKYIFLRNVFSFQNVSLFTTTFRNDSFNDKLIIRLFSNNIFYQYTFVMGKTDSSDAFILKEGDRFVYYVIFTDLYRNIILGKYPFDSFVRMLLSDDYHQFNCLFHSFLLWWAYFAFYYYFL